MKNLRKLSFLACSILLASATYAQFETAEVLGTVTDASGGAVSRSNVMLLNQNTGIQSKTITNDAGEFDFLNVRVGRYTVRVEAQGFSTAAAANIDVAVNARQRVDLTMQVGLVSDSVQVTGAAAVLDTDSSEHGQVITTEQIVELPLNGRNYSDLALLATNIHRSVLATAPITGTPREGAFNANGMRSTYNNFLLDGIDNNAYSTSNQGFSNQVAQPSPDAVQEFKVITEDYSAEYGRVGGAVVNVVMRSGTNRIHGTAYDFLRNTDLNAIGYIFGQRPVTFEKPTLHRNQFGLTVGGPIVKNRLFYFADYEGYRSLQKSLNFDSIPNLTDRQGILPNTVVDPLTGAVYKAGVQIPASVISPFAAQVLSQLPAPNGPGRSNDYQALLLTRDYSDKFDAKIDGQINDRMSASLRFSQRKDNQFYQPDIPGPSGGDGNGFVRALDQNAAAGYTWTVTPNSVFEARLGFSHILGGKFPPYLGGGSEQSLYGVPGLSTAPNLTGGLDTQNIGGFNILGRQATNPQFQNPTSWDPKANYSRVAGRHAIKVGVEGGIIHTEVMDINPVYGLNAYSGQFSKPSCAQLGQAAGCTVPSDSGTYNLADFLFGLPSQVQLANYLITNYRQRQFFAYAQDDYRVTPKLTLNLGLRWEFATPRWERDNNLTNFDPVANSLIHASNGSIYDRSLVHPDYRDWAPRVGFAYSITPKMVLRGGYGISYVHLNRLGSADELGINGPQVNIVTINQSPLLSNGKLNPNFITSSGFPAGLDSPANFIPTNANIAYIPSDTRWPMVQTWFLSAQKQLTGNTVLEISYSGNHSTRLPIIADYNQALPNLPGQTLGIQPRRPDQSFGAITWVDPAGSEVYDGLAVRLEHHLNHGLYLLNSFTWSKALGNSEQALEYGGGYYEANPQNIYNLTAERGPSSFDVKFIDVTSLVYQLPFGKGRQFGSTWNGLVDGALGGWELTSINTVNSGTPLDVSYTPSAANDVTGRIPDYRGEAIMRPNLIGDATGSGGAASLNNYFNKSAFQIPPASAPFGDLGRNALRGPNFWQWDVGVDKSFRIHEAVALQFRGEFFNVVNHTNFGIPDSNISDAAFGTIRTTYPPRQIQLALKLQF